MELAKKDRALFQANANIRFNGMKEVMRKLEAEKSLLEAKVNDVVPVPVQAGDSGVPNGLTNSAVNNAAVSSWVDNNVTPLAPRFFVGSEARLRAKEKAFNFNQWWNDEVKIIEYTSSANPSSGPRLQEEYSSRSWGFVFRNIKR